MTGIGVIGVAGYVGLVTGIGPGGTANRSPGTIDAIGILDFRISNASGITFDVLRLAG